MIGGEEKFSTFSVFTEHVSTIMSTSAIENDELVYNTCSEVDQE